MPNQKYAKEWLNLAWRNLETAKLLIREKHFTDSIAIEIHQVIEKSFKAVLAFNNQKIVKTHDLTVLYNLIKKYIEINNDNFDTLFTISDYYETEKYPGPQYYIPERKEVENNYMVAKEIYDKVKSIIDTL